MLALYHEINCFVTVSFFVCLSLWKIFSTGIQVILIDSCFVSGCNFDVSVGGREFSVFCSSLSVTSSRVFIVFKSGGQHGPQCESDT